MKTYGGVDVQIHVFLTSTQLGCKWPASRPTRFIPKERAPGSHWIEGWVGPRTGPDDKEKSRIPTALTRLLNNNNNNYYYLWADFRYITFIGNWHRNVVFIRARVDNDRFTPCRFLRYYNAGISSTGCSPPPTFYQLRPLKLGIVQRNEHRTSYSAAHLRNVLTSWPQMQRENVPGTR
jgi:hypothetical protein